MHLGGKPFLERFFPAAVVQHDVRLTADRSREVIHDLIRIDLARLGNPEIASRCRFDSLRGVRTENYASYRGQDYQRDADRYGYSCGTSHAVLALTCRVCQRLSRNRAKA